MNIIDAKVKHEMFGEGVVVAREGSTITVRFQEKKAKFMFPDAFKKFLSIKNKELAVQIQRKLTAYKAEKEAEQKRVTKARRNDYAARRARPTVRKRANARPNVAFKCNFCDGGRSTQQIGFSGVCSDKQIRYNVEDREQVWCSSEDSKCFQYLNGDISREDLERKYTDGELICYESVMFEQWRAFTGVVRSGNREGQPMRLRQVQTNSLCLLTTRYPNTEEKDRYIFGAFFIDDSYEKENQEADYVTTESKYKIKFTPKEAKKLLFWNYHANKSQPERPFWGSGLHRYFDDETAVQVLRDIIKVKQGTPEESLAREFFKHFVDINKIDPDTISDKEGALLQESEASA
ncbi:MAG: hypothetical protein GX316_01865 [Firmicutes bacterium]|nr:hypothetical protein [Bacillota bacterium]